MQWTKIPIPWNSLLVKIPPVPQAARREWEPGAVLLSFLSFTIIHFPGQSFCQCLFKLHPIFYFLR